MKAIFEPKEDITEFSLVEIVSKPGFYKPVDDDSLLIVTNSNCEGDKAILSMNSDGELFPICYDAWSNSRFIKISGALTVYN